MPVKKFKSIVSTAKRESGNVEIDIQVVIVDGVAVEAAVDGGVQVFRVGGVHANPGANLQKARPGGHAHQYQRHAQPLISL